MGRNIANRPSASGDTQAIPHEKTLVMAEMKAEILSLKKDFTTLLRSELKSVLADEFAGMMSEFRAVKEEVINSVATLRADVDSVKQAVTELEHSLSTCLDDITTIQTTRHKLIKDVAGLQERCVDLEGRMRRSNIQILNVTESPGSSSPATVSKLLKGQAATEATALQRWQQWQQSWHNVGKKLEQQPGQHLEQLETEILGRIRDI
ncbi:hypothetical protein MHYP_G00080520 [Metynnis hypsauchen]